MNHDKSPGNILTVVIRDDSPMIYCGDGPCYRSVQVQLTEDQIKQISLKYIGRSGEFEYYESISKCFIEPTI